MGAKGIAGIFEIGIDILCTTVSKLNSKITANTGRCNDVNSQPDAKNVEWWQHVGFASRPPKPNPSAHSAAQAIVIRQGNHDAAIASQDLRGLALYGQLSDGETCVYAPGADGKGQARALFKADGSVALYTKSGNTDGGTGMMIQLDAAGGGFRLIDSFGNAIISGSDGIKITAGGSCLTLGQSGAASLIGKGATQIDGSSICLGAVAVPGVNSVCVGVTGIAAAASTKVFAQLA